MRQVVCNVLLTYNIDTGQRHIQVTATKTKADYAHFMDWLVREHYPQERKIQLVQDNFVAHSYGDFYENLPFEQARQLKNKIEFHFTPKHGMVKYGRNRVFCPRQTMFR